MEFSEFFLNKLLEGAVSFYRNNKDIYVNPIPDKFNTIDESLEYFKNALVKEAHNSLKNEISLVDSPILHAINLDTETPGIIAGESKKKEEKEKLFLVFKKDKPKKEKTQEQIEKDIVRAQERELKKQLDKEKKEIEKEAIKKEKDDLKKSKEDLRNMKKETNEAMKISKEYKTRANEINKKLKNTPNPDDHLKEQHKTINDNSDKYTKLYENALAETLDFEEKTKKIENKIKGEAEEKKKIRLEKKEASQKKKQEKLEKLNKKMEEKEKKICEQADENDMGAMDDLFDALIEAGKNLENNSDNLENVSGDHLVNLKTVKLYESPLPFQRHIDAIKDCEPNSLIIKALLNGSKTQGDSYIKLIHGPPGTGKTYNLIKELKDMVDPKNNKKHKKILVCAPSNIATINLYERAKKEEIPCSLVISSKGKAIALKSNEDSEDINKKVIFSTVSMSSSSKLKNVEFTSIMMDEASQCQEAWFWGLLKPKVKYVYMTGDPHQLPALVSKEGNKLNHERSFMDRMISLGYESILLDTQRRMHPDIVKFSNFKYYENKLKTDYKPDKYVNKSLTAFEICNVEGNEQRVGTSYQNTEEASMVINLFNELKKSYDDIIIISPYNAQCSLLKSLESKLNKCIHSVDSYQGKEADVIILTTVRTENLGFWSDYRRLNVAMTRAKHVLRVVGNVESWKEGPLKDLKDFYELD